MNKNWSNTALVAYSLLPKIADELDCTLKNRINLGFQSRHFKIGISTEQLIDEIIQIIEEKRKIVNLRYIVKQALGKMNEQNKDILIARIVKRRTFQEIADKNKTSLRTVFRKVATAEEEFEHALKIAGFTESWFEKEYGSDKYISKVHERIMQDKYFVAKNL